MKNWTFIKTAARTKECWIHLSERKREMSFDFRVSIKDFENFQILSREADKLTVKATKAANAVAKHFGCTVTHGGTFLSLLKNDMRCLLATMSIYDCPGLTVRALSTIKKMVEKDGWKVSTFLRGS